jgi:pyruvate formate lyase activating enzyme
MDWVAAEFYRRQGTRIVCTLCPHACALEDGGLGRCNVRRRTGDRLETATFATALRHLDPVERKPFYHYRPGRKLLTLAAPGCSFACHYCQNHRLSQWGRSGDSSWTATAVDPAEIVDAAAAHAAAIGLSYSEPSLAAELTLALAKAGASRGVEVLWKTNGFITMEALEQIVPSLAAVNVDLKAVDDRRHRALTGAAVSPVLEAIAAFVRAGVWVEVSTPLIPGINTDDASVRGMAEAIARLGDQIPWHLVRFSPDFHLSRLAPTQPAMMERAVACAREVGLSYVYVERALGDEGRATRCPRCDTLLVNRDIWATRAVALKDAACPSCGTRIPGRWEGASS